MAQTVNEAILDAAIRHEVGLHRFSNSVVNKIISLLNKVDGEITTKLINSEANGSMTEVGRARLERILKAVRSIIQEGYAKVHPELQAQLLDLADYEVGYQQQSITTHVPVTIDLHTPPAEQLAAAVNAMPFQGALLSEWAKQLEDGAYRQVRNAIRMGFVQGETVDQMVRRLRGTKANKYKDGILEISRRDAEAVVRTAVNSVATRAREYFYDANTDIIKGVKWVSTLDNRTTPICRARDGKVYAVNTGPRPPAHINCRSTTVPITRSWQDLGINADEMPAGTRSSMNGQVPAEMTYNDWLKTQPKSVVVDVLGPSRADLYLKGGLTMDRFVNDAGRTLTLDELRARDSAAFQKAGL